jgi:urease accessory protein
VSASTSSLSCAQRRDGWLARLQLTFAARNGRTVLASRAHSGPLVVQQPFHPEGKVCHTYVVHPPGGVVAGDELQLEIEATPGSHALLTTPAAAKFYRSEGLTAQQTQTLIAEDGTIEWLPQESIFYPAARVRTVTRIELRSRSRFIGWETACLGLPARAESFASGELRLNFELWLEDRPLLLDRLVISGTGRAPLGRWGLAGYSALGTMLAYPATPAALAVVRALEPQAAELSSTLVDGVLVCRAVSMQAEPIKRAFVDVWRQLRPLLVHRPAVLPRIWAT